MTNVLRTRGLRHSQNILTMLLVIIDGFGFMTIQSYIRSLVLDDQDEADNVRKIAFSRKQREYMEDDCR